METIGGYRLVRRLGSGSRSDVYLGHAGREPDGGSRLAAIKVFRQQVSEESIDAEIAALGSLNHPHIAELLDLATGPRNSPCLVLKRLEPGGLAKLLGDRRDLDPGEAVTILAPLLRAATAMHRAGVVHGRLGVPAILFDSSGAPVISGFGSAGTIGPHGSGTVTEAILDDDDRVRGDREALVALMLSVLGRVREGSAGVSELAGWLGESPHRIAPGAVLEQRLFSLAAPLPVRFSVETEHDAVPHRLDAENPRRVAAAPDVGRPVTGTRGWFGQLALPPLIAATLAAVVERIPHWLKDRLGSLPGAVRSVRRSVWVVAAIGLVAVTAAVVVAQLPAKEQSKTSVSRDLETDSEAISPPPVPAPEHDPLDAATALLELRARCLHDRSLLCLDAVHAPDSAAWKADAARIRNLQDGGEIVADPIGRANALTLIDRMGDTALLGVAPAADGDPNNATASVLMIRTEAGWRFRSFLGGTAYPTDEQAGWEQPG